MSLINCPECGSQISNEASSCPHCGFGSNSKGKSGGCLRSIFQIFGVVILFAVLMNICSDEKTPNDKDAIAADTVYKDELLKIAESTPQKSGKRKLPNHKIISTEEYKSAGKASINIRIYERHTEDELESIAKSIRNQYPDYRRVFILYFLPKMEPGAGAWATISYYDTTFSINIWGSTQAEYDELSKDYKTDKYSSLKEFLSDDLNSSLIGDDFEIISDDKNKPIIKIFPLTVLGDDKDVIKETIRLDIVTISMFSFTYLNINSISVIAIPNQLTYEVPGNRNTAKWTKLKSYETKVLINRNNAIAVIKKWKLGSGFHDLYDDSYGLIGMPTGKYNIVMGEKEFFDQLIN